MSKYLLPVLCLYLFLCSFVMVVGQSRPPFSSGVNKGRLPLEFIDEASGLEMSRKNSNILWTHNDSGDSARVFAIDTNGKLVKIFLLPSITNRDWEDIAIGPGPVKNQDYIYIAEIGDNLALHRQNYIYRFQEPKIILNDPLLEKTIHHIEKFPFVYPDGKRDAETLMIDYQSQELYIVTKRESRVRLYKAPIPTLKNKLISLEYMRNFNFSLVTGGDISQSGNEIILKTYDSVYYWKRQSTESISNAMARTPILLPYLQEPQGEGICWATNNQGYYTLSEFRYKVKPWLKYYPRQSN